MGERISEQPVEKPSTAYRRYSRRSFLKKMAIPTGMLSLGIVTRPAINLANAQDDLHNFFSYRDLDKRLDHTYPLEDKRRAEKEINRVMKEVATAIERGKEGEVEKLIGSPEYLAAVRAVGEGIVDERERERIKWQTKRELIDLVKGTGSLWVTLSSFIVGGMGINWAYSTIKEKRKADKLFKKFIKSAVDQNIPEQSLYLGPVGGKIPLTDKRRTDYILNPALTVEGQVKQIDEYKEKRRLGKMYVHQMTIQGRLPDEFKLAAIALILHSPYQNDWDEPFFEADWAKVAPLVHDGLAYDPEVNFFWREVHGRTDFLQRVSRVHYPQIKELEGAPVEEIVKRPSKELKKATFEQLERKRLFLEGRAYQSLALALHAKTGTAPKFIPNKLRQNLSEEWVKFSVDLRALLGEYHLEGVADVEWFVKKPKEIPGFYCYGPRFEAPWEPIKEQLKKMEEVRFNNPELQDRVSVLLANSVQRINQVIGLE